MANSFTLILAFLLSVALGPALALTLRNTGEAYNSHHPHRDILKRAITVANPADVSNKAYDFVVVGGGLAGLTVAARLAEWSNVTVLVIEAGGDGSDVADQQSVPGFSYMRGLTGTSYGWGYSTINQTSCLNLQKTYPLGRGLGGSGAVNGMFWCRGASTDYDAWGSLNSGSSESWNFQEVNNHIKKAENCSPPGQEQQATFHIPFDPSFHGTSGPIHTGFSQYIYPPVANWIPTWTGMGFKAMDHAGGENRGTSITPSIINVQNQSRCDSKSYIYSAPPRPNLTILTGQQATKIGFNNTAEGSVTANSVTFQSSAASQAITVQVNKEVIVSSGSINSPKLLQLSGIGPAAVVQQMGVTPVLDLPVGYNYQDHVSGTMYFNTVPGTETWFNLATNTTLQEQALAQWKLDHTGPLTYVNEAVGYVSATDIAGPDAATLAQAFNVDATVQAITTKYNLPASVQKGLAAQYKLLQTWLTADVSQFEIIMHLWGSNTNNIGIQFALQHPFSRGTVFASSGSAFDAPLINPDYYGVDLDATMHTAAAQWVRKLAASAPMNTVVVGESAPGANITGAALTNYIKQKAGTEFHPVGTNSMLPKDMGGVVDTKLKIYGTSNIRVIDASIIPLHVSAHTMATTYGIAEKGADLIKADHMAGPPTTASTTASASTSSSAAIVPGDSAASNSSSSSLSSGAKIGIGIGAGVGVLALIFAIAYFWKSRQDGSAAADKNGWYSRGEANGQWAGEAPTGNDAYVMNAQQGGYNPLQGGYNPGYAANAGYGPNPAYVSNHPAYPEPVSYGSPRAAFNNRPLSFTGSIDTMATNELPHRQ